MKRHFFFTLIMSGFLSYAMENQQTTVISKQELITLIKNKDAHRVKMALEHQNGAAVIDDEVRRIAQENHTEPSILSRSGSIARMIHAQEDMHGKEKIEKKSSLTSSTKSRKSTKHHQKKVEVELYPKQNLLELVKKQDLEGLNKALASSQVYFIDTDITNAAQAEVQRLENSLALAQTIAKTLNVYVGKSRPEKRKSRILN